MASVVARPDAGGVVRVRGYRLPDLTTAFGTVLFGLIVGAWFGGWSALSRVELFLTYAMLVLVPIGLGLALTPTESGIQSTLSLTVIAGQLPAAVLTIVGFTAPPGTGQRIALVLPWTVLTAVVGLFGAHRLLSRGLTPIPALAIDSALFYLPVAGVFMSFHALEITFHFQPLIVLLTGVHFHYAGFVLPLVVGLAGQRLQPGEHSRFQWSSPVFTAGTLGIIVGNTLIAVAITLSPWLEFPAVAAFVLVIAATMVVMLVELAPRVPRVPGGLLAIATLSLLAGMALAVAYSYSVFPPTGHVITISEMIRWHGPLNAVGFALSALVAFRLLDA